MRVDERVWATGLGEVSGNRGAPYHRRHVLCLANCKARKERADVRVPALVGQVVGAGDENHWPEHQAPCAQGTCKRAMAAERTLIVERLSSQKKRERSDTRYT